MKYIFNPKFACVTFIMDEVLNEYLASQTDILYIHNSPLSVEDMRNCIQDWRLRNEQTHFSKNLVNIFYPSV